MNINLLDPNFYIDPWDSYRWLRDEAPVFWDPVQKLWGISRYDDILAIERDGSLYSSFHGTRPHIDSTEDTSMINMDDPAHQAQRKLVSRQFTPRGAGQHESRIRQVVAGILDAVAPLGECEAIEALASRLPAIMIGELLGYPPHMWKHVRHWSEQVMFLAGQTSPDGPPHLTPPGIVPVMREWTEATVALIDQRRRQPQDDLISKWVHTEGWDTKHVLDETVLVLDGGAETTRTVIGSMIRELALQPEVRRTLIDDPDLLSTTAIDEFIRWVSPVLNMRRTSSRDHQFHDQQIRSGDQLLLMYPSANRDPRAFDHPDVLDVTRTHNRHVAFGFGTHFCLGAQLARLEIRVMFEEMLQRIPDWQLVDPEEPQILPATFARAYDRIRIRFAPT